MTTTAQGFTAAQGYIEYHTITRAGWRGCCAPYGVCGPFASEGEAFTALELLRTAQRDPSLTVARCGILATSDTAADLVDVPSRNGAECGVLVDPGDIQDSVILQMLTGTQGPTCSPVPMPLGNDDLPPDELQCVTDYLQALADE